MLTMAGMAYTALGMPASCNISAGRMIQNWMSDNNEAEKDEMKQESHEIEDQSKDEEEDKEDESDEE